MPVEDLLIGARVGATGNRRGLDDGIRAMQRGLTEMERAVASARLDLPSLATPQAAADPVEVLRAS